MGTAIPTMPKCNDLSGKAFIHVMIWFPVAYILVWGLLMLHRRIRKYKSQQVELLESLDCAPAEDECLPRYTDTPFVDTPLVEESPEVSRGSLALPAKHTAPCLGPRANQATVIALHCVITVCCLAGGIQVLSLGEQSAMYVSNKDYTGTLLIVMAVVWTWATVILLIAPASASCSVPIFWTLAFYAQVVAGWSSGCSFWNQEHTGLKVCEATTTFSNILLLVLSWRQFAGLTLMPLLLLSVLCQACIGLVQMVQRRCSGERIDEDTLATSTFSAPLMASEEIVLADGETVVELMIYDLWPSWLPLYVGGYMGAYHTGIAAHNKPGSSIGPLEYTFECPHGVVARKRGKKPSYVQGEICRVNGARFSAHLLRYGAGALPRQVFS